MTIRLFCCVVLIALTAAASRAQAGTATITKMGNGLTVVLLEDHSSELVGVDVWVRAGSAHETPGENGAAHMLEHLLFGATARREIGEMDLEMESLGATLDARTSRDWAHFNTTVCSRYLARALDVLADAMISARIEEVAVEQERMVILDEIAAKRTDPVKALRELLARELYGTHPYAYPIEGAPESIRNLGKEQIQAFYKRHYVAANMAIVLVGDIDAAKAVSEVGRAFQYLPRDAPPAAIAAVTPLNGQVTRATRLQTRSDYLAIAFVGPKGADYKDVCATDVLLTYLGFGYRSWMNDELVRQMGLATASSTDFLTQREPGMISLVAAVAPGNVEKAKGAVFARIETLKDEGVTDYQLALAKRSLLGQFAFENETVGGRANSYGFYYSCSEPDFAEKYIECVQSVTNEEVVRAARVYLDTARAVVLVAGPTQGVSQ